MFDKKKIILNSLRSLKANNKKVNLFLNKLSEESIQRLEINKINNFRILEILPKNNIFYEKLKEERTNGRIWQTCFSNDFKFNKKKLVVNDNELSAIENETALK